MSNTTILFRRDIPDREETFLIAVAPQWSKDASAWLKRQDASWRTMARITCLVMLAFGLPMLAGTWYTSIQGVRIPLVFLGLPMPIWGIPAWYWWIFPAGSTFIQVFCRKLPWLRGLWAPSIWYDGLTNAVAFGFAALVIAGNLGVEPNAVYIGSVVAVLGFLAAVAAEQIVIGALAMFVLLRK